MKILNTYVLTEVGDDIVAVPVEESAGTSRHVVRLNATAAEIWHGIEEGKSLEEIAQDFANEYEDLDEAAALGYVNEAVKTLIDAGIAAE